MKKLNYQDFVEYYNKFYDQYNIFVTLQSLVRNSNLSEAEKDNINKSIEEKYDGFTNVYEDDVYTDVTDELLSSGIYKYSDPFKEIIQHIGEECCIDNINGTLKAVVSTIEDFYYIIEVEGKDIWFSAVAKIEFKNNKINKA